MRDHQIRMCVVCRKRAPKEDLLRIVSEGTTLLVDSQQRLGKRGVYFHRDPQCLLGKIDEGRIARALRIQGLTRSELRRVLSEIEYVKD